MAPLSAVAERRDLLSRIVSGLVLVPLAVLVVSLGGLAFDIAVGAAAAIGLAEWLRMVNGKARSPRGKTRRDETREVEGASVPAFRPSMAGAEARPTAVFSPGTLPALSMLAIASTLGVQLAWGAVDALICLAFEAAILGLAVRARGGAGLLAAFGLPYVGLSLVALVWLRDFGREGWSLVLFLFLVVWGSDIGAFVAGRGLGGPKLAPTISPNKTWAGFAGGLLLSACIALIWNASMAQTPRPPVVLGIAVGLSLLGQGGDLFESMMKRRFGVKDSGTLIPGHGGMLDRIDALLWVAPAFVALHLLGLTRGLFL